MEKRDRYRPSHTNQKAKNDDEHVAHSCGLESKGHTIREGRGCWAIKKQRNNNTGHDSAR